MNNRYAKFDRDRLRNDGENLREKTAVEKNKKIKIIIRNTTKTERSSDVVGRP